ncbi:MAG: pyridoxal phosphate-dependent aminotransferase [Burkholderiales bacterium]
MKTVSPHHFLSARPAVESLRASKIREVADAGMGLEDIIAFWFGEPDETTPEFIRQAGIDAINAGDTFYTQNFGIPELRETIAGYVSGLRAPVSPGEVAVTNSGMSALMLATQALVGPGDRVVIVTPLWPNLVEIPKIMGAQVVTVPLSFHREGWQLDLDRLTDALVPGTRALYINSPNNPTGWTLAPAQRDAIASHCREHGIWILADDAYERLYYAGAPAQRAAPSFMDMRDSGDRIICANTFSKSWLMTGWRLGWLVAPKPLMEPLSKLIEYNTCCTPGFVQRAGIAAIRHGEPVVARTLERFRLARDVLLQRLQSMPGVEAAIPPGAMYAFFRVHGMTDSLAFCKRMVREFGLGLAPGAAFGPEGEGYLRWCFAAAPERLSLGIVRFEKALQAMSSHR